MIWYRRAILVFSGCFVLIGLALLVVTAVNGGGLVGFVLGGLFVALGGYRHPAPHVRAHGGRHAVDAQRLADMGRGLIDEGLDWSRLLEGDARAELGFTRRERRDEREQSDGQQRVHPILQQS